jgi:hypothetical protein
MLLGYMSHNDMSSRPIPAVKQPVDHVVLFIRYFGWICDYMIKSPRAGLSVVAPVVTPSL